MLCRVLESGELYSEHRSALGHPWCWPRSSALHARALSLGLTPPPLPGPGEVLLLSVSSDGLRSALWRLVWRHSTTVETFPFSMDAVQDLMRLPALVERFAPLLFRRVSPGNGGTGAQLIHQHGQGRDAVLHGASFGLSMALGLASRCWELALPTNVVATARVDQTGRLLPVKGLAQKVALVAGSALGVERLLVARAQSDEARQAVAAHGGGLDVVPVGDLEEALSWLADVCMPHREHPGWRGADGGTPVSRAAVKDVFNLAMSGAGLPTWAPVVRAAECLSTVFPAGSCEGVRASTAAQIARRHANMDAPMAWPVDPQDAWPEDTWNLIAHAVQAAADSNLDEAVTFRERAEALVGAHRLPVHLRVLGAVQRSYGITREYARAVMLGRELVSRWMKSQDPSHASFALCEWIRAEASVDASDGVEVEREAEQLLSGLGDPASPAGQYVRVALGRSRVLHGRSIDDVGQVLGPDAAPWDSAATELQITRARWWIRALWLAGRHHDAQRERQAVAASADPRIHLVELERSLLQGAGDEEIRRGIGAFRDGNPQAIRWLLDKTLPPKAQALRIVNEYAY